MARTPRHVGEVAVPDVMDAARRAALALGPLEWRSLRREMDDVFARRSEERRAMEARTAASGLDMTPEGYVREWDARGRANRAVLPAWERAYQDAGLIAEAERLGYLSIGRGPDAPVSVTTAGEALLEGTRRPAGPGA